MKRTSSRKLAPPLLELTTLEAGALLALVEASLYATAMDHRAGRVDWAWKGKTRAALSRVNRKLVRQVARHRRGLLRQRPKR